LAEETRRISENDWIGARTGMDVEALKRALEEEQKKAEKNLLNWQKAEADFSNYRKRVEQEKAELISFANAKLLTELLTVIDDFERAFANVPPEMAQLPWVDGVRLVHQKLRSVLKSQGVTEIESAGKPFDPNIHEAVMQQPGEEGSVIEEVQKGYMMKDRLIRAAKVVVGSGKKVEASEAEV